MGPPKKYPKSLRKKGAMRSVARAHADYAAMQPKEYWNDWCPIEWGELEDYEVKEDGRDMILHCGFGERRWWYRLRACA